MNPDTNFTLAQLSVSLRVSTDLITDVAYLTGNLLRFTLNPSDSTAGLSSQELTGLLNVSSVTVARVPSTWRALEVCSRSRWTFNLRGDDGGSADENLYIGARAPHRQCSAD